MILKDDTEVVTMTGLGETKKFAIKASAKAFAILSAKMYSDPVRAIIRELSCNAYDSHVAAGCADKPFTLKLPNHLDRSFYVEDYGLGLSEEDVLTVYSTYFESTKAESNEFTGALGLGSKTPFSYTKEFIVISRFEGKETTYSAFIDSDGGPAIAPVSCVDTDKCNGVRVELSIVDRDRGLFNDKARSVMRPFEGLVDVIGLTNFALSPHGTGEIIADKTDFSKAPDTKWTCYSSDYYNNRGVVIIQGNIEYPVSDSHVSVPNWMANTKVVITVPIGSFEFSASREEIHYSDGTAEMIQEVVNEIDTESNKEVQELADKIKTRYEWSRSQGLYNIIHNKNTTVEWNGKYLKHGDIYSMKNLIDADNEILDMRINKTSLKGYYDEYSINDKFDHILIVDKPYLAASKALKIYRCATMKLKGDTPEERAAAGKRLLKAHGYPDDQITLASEIPNPVIAKQKSRGTYVSKITVSQYNDNPVTVEPQDKVNAVIGDNPIMVIYVPTYKRKAVKILNKELKATVEDTDAVAAGLLALMNIGIGGGYYRVIGVPIQHIDKVEDYWFTLEEGIKFLTTKAVRSKDYSTIVKYKSVLNDDFDRDLLIKHRKGFANIDGFSDMVKIEEKIRDIKSLPYYYGLLRLATYLKARNKVSEEKLLKATAKGVYTKYPMLEMIIDQPYYISNRYELIVDYIDLANVNSV